MGQGRSKNTKIGMAAAKIGGKKADSALYLGATATGFEHAALGIKHLSDTYANFKKQPNGAPSVHVFSSSITALFRDRDCVRLLSRFLQGAQVVAYILNVLEEAEMKQLGIRIANELSAQTSLRVPKIFASHVYAYAKSESATVYEDGLQHLYFLFHPDNNWHPEFKELVANEPLPNNLVAMSESLDCLVVWMKFIRGHLDRINPKISKRTMFHLIIPAYETTVIKDPLEFPNVGLLMIQGETYRQQPFMWFNLPTIDNYPEGLLTFKYIGNTARPESKWKDVATKATGMGVFVVTTGLFFCASGVCPPVMLAMPILAPLGSSLAASTVEERFSKEVPRVLGTESNNDNADGDENDANEDVIIQPGTKHVRQRKHRHGSRRGHRPSRSQGRR